VFLTGRVDVRSKIAQPADDEADETPLLLPPQRAYVEHVPASQEYVIATHRSHN
jgi:hypothetical protein